MSSRYKVRDQEGLFFVTFTIIGWVDLFTRQTYRDCVIDALQYCIRHKGLQVHAYVIMSSHIHAIISAEAGHELSSIIRDFKKYTSKSFIRLIKEIPESRREWLLNKFRYEAQKTRRGKDYIVWREGYHAKQIETNEFLDQKLTYIHQNPVEADIVSRPEDYIYSSARNYSEEESVLPLVMLL